MTPRTFILDKQERLQAFSTFISKQPLPLDVTVKPHVVKRSDAQNRRLWALHQLAADVIGCSAADAHEDRLCEHYGYNEVKMPSGFMQRVPMKRSSTRDKKEFRLFLDYVEAFYADNLGVWLGKDD